ncbi:MAG: type II toxin-antitoxin system VapC family toxin [Trueperaceae bacterium]
MNASEMRYYDTSVLLSLYLQQNISAKASVEVAKDQPYVVISDWVSVEVKSALAKEVRTKSLTKLQAEIIWERFYQDIQHSRYKILHLTQNVMAKAHECIALDGNLRAGDAIHVAVAFTHGRLSIVTADKEQAKAAKLNGLKVTLL